MNEMLERCLDDLENRIDPDEEIKLFEEWHAFLDGGFTGDIFSPRRRKAVLPGVHWPNVLINDTLQDYDLMALHQFRECSNQLAQASGSLLGVRCNYGTSIIPLLFGTNLFLMDEKANTLPTSHPLHNKSAIKSLISAGVPDLKQGFGVHVFEMGERFSEIKRQYPRIGDHVFVYHPDLQGPMDICEIVWGSSFFLDLYDEPDLVHDFLNLIVETYTAFMREWEKIHPSSPEENTHWGMLHKGTIMLRDDSATNFSPRMFEEFILPYDQILLERFGGGAVHFCGKGDHFIEDLSTLRGLHAVNLSQPELNDMEKIFHHTTDKNIRIIGLNRTAAEKALATRKNLWSLIHCFQ